MAVSNDTSELNTKLKIAVEVGEPMGPRERALAKERHAAHQALAHNGLNVNRTIAWNMAVNRLIDHARNEIGKRHETGTPVAPAASPRRPGGDARPVLRLV